MYTPGIRKYYVPALSALTCALALQVATAATVDLTTVPLINGQTLAIPPNIMVDLDDSGSMAWNYIPDVVGGNSTCAAFLNSTWNPVAYNPNITYTAPPVSAGGSALVSSFTAAQVDGYYSYDGGSSTPVNLGASFVPTVTVVPYGSTASSNAGYYNWGVDGAVSTDTSGATGSTSGFKTNSSYTPPTGTTSSSSNLRANDKTVFTGLGYTLTSGNASSSQTGTDTYQKSSTTTSTGTVVYMGSTISVTLTTALIDQITVTASSSGYRSSTTSTTVTDATQKTVTTALPAFYMAYTGSGAAPAPTISGSNTPTCPSNSNYTLTFVTGAAAQQNFANWFSFYTTRVNLMKATLGNTFSTLPSSYRVGFTVISDPSTSGSKFVAPGTWSTNNSTWYKTLYAINASGSTPLRPSLNKLGLMYAGKLSGMTGTSDPVIYSCQKNYAFLATDGYWNTGSESSYSGYTNGTRTLSGGAIGEVDNAVTNAPYLKASGTPVSATGTNPPNPTFSSGPPYYDGGISSNSLADIAYYFYNTDLRPTSVLGGLTPSGTQLDVSTNNVPTTPSDPAPWQHMTLFTMGLGVPGTLIYSPYYQSGGSSDYNKILAGTLNWPDPQTTSSSSSVVSRIDDLWHAAVNGHGQYFSAGNPALVTQALNATLSTITQSTGAGASAATSSLQPVSGNNYAYTAQFTSALWQGDLTAETIDLTTGAVGSTANWDAASLLNSAVSASSDTRTIYTYSGSPTTTNGLKTFVAANLTTEIGNNYFASGTTNPNGALSQYNIWTSAYQSAATPAAMIGYLRGETGFTEIAGNTYPLFRARGTPLGDIVDSAPVYVGAPPFNYTDSGYSTFAAANASRQSVVYAGANDGMLHAFNGQTGNELWAYIPSVLIPYLYKLADDTYPSNHRFYVDGPLTAGDAYNGSQWVTLLIGGLGDGGRAYFAMDVTNPSSPKLLWEVSSATIANLGNSYGNPMLTKRASDGRWVVVVTSGYNNTSPGDGKGHLFVLDAFTGTLLEDIVASSTVTDPNVSGIGKAANYVANPYSDNTTQYVYGGDLGGSLWRFDINSATSQRLGETSATVGNQPITVRPEIGQVTDTTGKKWVVAYFGTGRYLGASDLGGTSETVAQAVYAVKDTGTDIGVLTTAAANLVAQTLDTAVSPRTIDSPAAVNWSSSNGWYITTPVGERFNVAPKLQLGTLALVSNSPQNSYCVVGGTSILYALNYLDGSGISNKTVGWPVGNALSTGLAVYEVNGKVIALVTRADGQTPTLPVPTTTSGAGILRRVSWREIN